MTRDRTIGLERRDGAEIGRDPRRMTGDELEVLGHRRMSPLHALRLRCIDCSGDSATEVRMCTAVRCPAWPFRMGTNPWRASVSEARREAARRAAAKMNAIRVRDSSIPRLDARSGEGATTLPADTHREKIRPGTGGAR